MTGSGTKPCETGMHDVQWRLDAGKSSCNAAAENRLACVDEKTKMIYTCTISSIMLSEI